jgi:hypothetical protein
MTKCKHDTLKRRCNLIGLKFIAPTCQKAPKKEEKIKCIITPKKLVILSRFSKY